MPVGIYDPYANAMRTVIVLAPLCILLASDLANSVPSKRLTNKLYAPAKSEMIRIKILPGSEMPKGCPEGFESSPTEAFQNRAKGQNLFDESTPLTNGFFKQLTCYAVSAESKIIRFQLVSRVVPMIWIVSMDTQPTSFKCSKSHLEEISGVPTPDSSSGDDFAGFSYLQDDGIGMYTGCRTHESSEFGPNYSLKGTLRLNFDGNQLTDSEASNLLIGFLAQKNKHIPISNEVLHRQLVRNYVLQFAKRLEGASKNRTYPERRIQFLERVVHEIRSRDDFGWEVYRKNLEQIIKGTP